MGAITTKESYYFTSLRLDQDARQFLVPWMGYDRPLAVTDEAWQGIGRNWFQQALAAADVGVAKTSTEYYAKRNYISPGRKLPMQQACTQHFLLEGMVLTPLPVAVLCALR
jgi:hypothetical protein